MQQAEGGHQRSVGDSARGQLGPAQRAADWQRLAAEQFDVLVIGGGVVGSGAALDAATRGLKVALVEARDLASGTSSRSSKLVHGGLRYLEQLEFGLVREALRERELMLTRLAPHLVKPVSFLYPLAHRIWERPYVAAGLTLYQDAGRRPVSAGSTPPHPSGRAAAGAGLAPGEPRRWCPLLRRDHRRCSAHHDGGPHRRPLRRCRAQLHPGHRFPAGGGSNLRGPGAGLRDRRGDRRRGARGAQLHRRVDR